MPGSEQAVIQPFINSLQFEKRYSLHTIEAYNNDLLQFFEYLYAQFGEMDLNQISSSFIRSWLASLKENDYTAKSINRKLSALKSFFKYQLKTGVVTNMPVLHITAPKISRRLPVYLEKAQVTDLFTKVEFPDNWRGYTDRLLLTIFYNTGMRLSEQMNLKESQVNPATNTIKILGKGNKERLVPVSPKLMEDIQDYIRQKKVMLEAPDTIHLLVTPKGRKLTRGTVYITVKKYIRQVATIEKKGPHVLRHTFATHLMDNGADINAVKELLGHASLASTQIYVHNTIERLKKVHKKAHPRA